MPRLLRLAVAGTAAGAFSGLFGVGGGVVMVPLLILWLGYGEREATGTSLAAIISRSFMRSGAAPSPNAFRIFIGTAKSFCQISLPLKS